MAAPPSSSSSSNGTLILILGILSIICLPILGPVALIMGNNALPTADPSQAGTINAGRICGIIGTVILCLAIIWAIVSLVFGAALFHHAATMPTSPASP